MIYHIAHQKDWAAAQESGSYTVESLQNEGFIHLSTAAQVVKTANNYYQGVSDLVILRIDDGQLDNEKLRYEAAPYPPHDLFPHYYDALPTTAAVQTVPLVANEDGTYSWPSDLE